MESVPDDGFKLQADVCRTFYVLKLFSTNLSLYFFYDTETHPDILSQDFSRYI